MDQQTSKLAIGPAGLANVWRRLAQDETAAIAAARKDLACAFPLPEDGYEEDEAFIYLPVTILVRDGERVRQDTVSFAIGDRVLVTLEPAGGFPVFDKAANRLQRRPELVDSAHGVMLLLLNELNSAAGQIVELASSASDALGQPISEIMEGVDGRGREIGVSDISGTMAELNQNEDLVSRILESQLLLARAARYLRSEIDGSNPLLKGLVDTLISDIQGVKEHAGFEHDKLRYLQNSVMTSLNVKQNQIVKVFTIITAVFLPPTLVATFYGMNFAVMPELAWTHGFTSTIVLTLLAALLPLWYIKRKGWLR